MAIFASCHILYLTKKKIALNFSKTAVTTFKSSLCSAALSSLNKGL